MLDLRVPPLPLARGERVGQAAYKREFAIRDSAIRGGSSWKLERRQHFEEAGNPSREALRRGEWDEALRLIEARRDKLRGIAADETARRAVFHRVRVVEEPLTPYLQWELHSLRLSAQYGERVRILPAKAVAAAESDSPLPELVVQDDVVLYRVLYTDAGAPHGAVRFTDPEIVDPWVAYLRHAYATAEDIFSYFDRVVAHLPPPAAV